MNKRKASKVRARKAKSRKAAKPKPRAAKPRKATPRRAAKRPVPKARPQHVAAVAVVRPAPVDVRRAAAREIFAYLVRETLSALPPGSPQRSNPNSLGYTPQLDRGETVERHRKGMEAVRHSLDVTLAFGRLGFSTSDAGAGNPEIVGAAAWYSDVEPALRRGCENFQRDRFVGILDLVEDVCALVESRYGAVALPVAMSLTRASVMAYGHGFFIRYNAQRAGSQAR